MGMGVIRKDDCMQEVILTEEELKELLPYWQKVLRLQDWIIKVELCKQSEIQEGRAAEINYVLANKQASIKILRHEDHPNDAWFPHDMEWSLVHELLHLHISTLDPENDDKGITGLFEEQAIESITHGLIALKRSE